MKRVEKKMSSNQGVEDQTIYSCCIHFNHKFPNVQVKSDPGVRPLRLLLAGYGETILSQIMVPASAPTLVFPVDGP